VKKASLLLTPILFALLAIPAPGVTITIVNKDATGQGLNDPIPATPIGGNPGTTIGQQRLAVFNEAARIWGEILPGNVEIKVDASFTALTCTSTSAVLGGAGPTAAESDFTFAPTPNTWYVVAEANQISRMELNPNHSAIVALFNAKLGQAGCFDGHYFYYGFDTKTPSSDINFLTVALHEFAHGLGFISLADDTTGKFCCATQPQPDIFDTFVYDTTAQKTWATMSSNSDRQVSAINGRYLVWNGPAANAAGAAALARGVPALMISSPPAVAGSYTVGTADFGATITPAGVTGTLVEAIDPIDSSGVSPRDGCSPLTNAAVIAGKIALVDRGTCSFALKATNAQLAGAVGLVVTNNSESVVSMARDSGNLWSAVHIPVVSVSQSDGMMLRANLLATLTIGIDSNWRRGMNREAQLLLYAPNPVVDGSSISHWDTSAYPNLLMEPFMNDDLPISADITPELLRDIGWFGTPPTAKFSFTPATPVTGEAVVFTDASSGGPTSWSWSFGDGATSNVESPTHVYTSAGTKTVSLTVANAIGSNTKTASLAVAVGGGGKCTETISTMCLVGGRYKVTSYWQNQYAGFEMATLKRTTLTNTTGAFWLSNSNTFEYLIRINTATDNGHAWISIPTFTDVQFWITVQDLVNGQSKTYVSLAGNRSMIYDPLFFVYP
jgi:PKD repeat protein